MIRLCARLSLVLLLVCAAAGLAALAAGRVLPSEGQIVYVTYNYGRGTLASYDITRQITARLHGPMFSYRSGPSWANDGVRYAYVLENDVYVNDLNTGESVNVTRSAAIEVSPSWSPNGSVLSFVSDRYFQNRDLYLSDLIDGEVEHLGYHNSDEDQPVWSPDGRTIAYISNRNFDYEIYTMNVETRRENRLTDNRVLDYHPAWSPDGTMIAFTSNRDGNLEVYVMEANGDNPRNITHHPSSDQRPTWSPDGQRLVFVSERDGRAEIYTIDLDGTNARRITYNDAADSFPAWLP
jgi:Tol biopolymer transport system component